MAHLGLWIALVCMLYTLAIFQIYGIYKFKSLQSLLIIQKRYPQMVLAEAMALIIWLMIAAPIWANYQYQSTNFGIESAENFLFNQAQIFHIPFAYFISLAELSRLYLISFHLHYLHASRNEQWKSQIDESFIEKDWYLKNKNIFGNYRYVLIVASIYVIISIVCVSISFLIDETIGGIINIIFLTIPIIFVLTLYFKSRNMFQKLGDKFFFYYAFRAVALISTFCLVMNIIFSIVYYLVSDGAVTRVFIFLNGTLAYTAPSLVSTVVITRKVLSLHVWTTLKHNFDEEIVTPSAIADTDKESMNATDRIYAMLKDQDKCEEFIHFMYKVCLWCLQCQLN